MDDARLGNLIDRSEILDLYARYALGMDRGDRLAFAGVWTPDAEWRCDALGFHHRGRDAILAYFDDGPGAAPSTPAPGSSLRVASNHSVSLDGETATAVAEFAAFRYTGQVVHPYSVGVYEDEFTRTPDGWLLSARTMIISPVVPVPAAVAAG